MMINSIGHEEVNGAGGVRGVPPHEKSGGVLRQQRRQGRILLLLLGLVTVYFVSGRLALFLAIPPGYAAPIWPPAGVALAFMLLYSYRMWPGVWVGSFLLNVYVSLNTHGTNAQEISVTLPAIIATGAVLQAVVG
ncbi:MAG: MASE1 domain-containing protein, partial [Nitrospirae bacterium]|nr:MASE1 domain-containing protein [Nitrospirota bacterium]